VQLRLQPLQKFEELLMAVATVAGADEFPGGRVQGDE